MSKNSLFVVLCSMVQVSAHQIAQVEHLQNLCTRKRQPGKFKSLVMATVLAVMAGVLGTVGSMSHDVTTSSVSFCDIMENRPGILLFFCNYAF
ncbi:hypothetical protein GGU10DRAFT_369837 [Lentinula aff. detonsa]|uniref:Uncharacterized protein n=1 Tax=Lentinula aff. detonsa TaxID=2804958 RepID=A0AA38K7L1_9AGAR|nr:hypothetical protein GGU10DRAFT_369837 [Lentinula aff. detonsa]